MSQLDADYEKLMFDLLNNIPLVLLYFNKVKGDTCICALVEPLWSMSVSRKLLGGRNNLEIRCRLICALVSLVISWLSALNLGF